MKANERREKILEILANNMVHKGSDPNAMEVSRRVMVQDVSCGRYLAGSACCRVLDPLALFFWPC